MFAMWYKLPSTLSYTHFQIYHITSSLNPMHLEWLTWLLGTEHECLRIILAFAKDQLWRNYFLANCLEIPLLTVVRSAIVHKVNNAKGVQTRRPGEKSRHHSHWQFPNNGHPYRDAPIPDTYISISHFWRYRIGIGCYVSIWHHNRYYYDAI